MNVASQGLLKSIVPFKKNKSLPKFMRERTSRRDLRRFARYLKNKKNPKN